MVGYVYEQQLVLLATSVHESYSESVLYSRSRVETDLYPLYSTTAGRSLIEV